MSSARGFDSNKMSWDFNAAEETVTRNQKLNVDRQETIAPKSTILEIDDEASSEDKTLANISEELQRKQEKNPLSTTKTLKRRHNTLWRDSEDDALVEPPVLTNEAKRKNHITLFARMKDVRAEVAREFASLSPGLK